MRTPVRPRATRCQSSSRLASISRWTAKCGVLVQLASVRSAIARQAPLTAATPAGGGEVATAAATAVPDARTSAASTGRPVRFASALRSTPASRAIRRASGDAGTRAGALSTASRGGSASAGACSPAARIKPITVPTGTSSPACAVTTASVPSAGDFQLHRDLVGLDLDQRLALADGVAFCAQPADHLPVSCAIPSTGMITSIAMATRALPMSRAAARPGAIPLPLRCDCVSRVVASGPPTVR